MKACSEGIPSELSCLSFGFSCTHFAGSSCKVLTAACFQEHINIPIARLAPVGEPDYTPLLHHGSCVLHTDVPAWQA